MQTAKKCKFDGFAWERGCPFSSLPIRLLNSEYLRDPVAAGTRELLKILLQLKEGSED